MFGEKSGRQWLRTRILVFQISSSRATNQDTACPDPACTMVFSNPSVWLPFVLKKLGENGRVLGERLRPSVVFVGGLRRIRESWNGSVVEGRG